MSRGAARSVAGIGGLPQVEGKRRPDRQFYAKSSAFGRFGIRWFSPVLMDAEHAHGHIEFNWLSAGSMRYTFDGRPVTIPAQRLVMFWAGIPHQTIGIDYGREDNARQCNIYLPLDVFLHMPHLGALHETMLGGGVICLTPESIDPTALTRWYQDYRSGDPERIDLVKVEIGALCRRASIVGWDELLPPWIESTLPSAHSAAPVRYVVTMLRYILENISEPLTMEDVAKVVGLHPNYALNLFTHIMHVPVRKFIVRMRLVRARSLLFESNLSIANVAYQSGFTSLSQFYDHFRRAYGVTPLEMRKRLVTE